MNSKEMHKFTYEGPVFEFERIIDPLWISSTVAVSKAKALNNLSTQFKKMTGRTLKSKVSLSPKHIKEVID